MTITQIASRARFLKRRHDIKLVVIDYLQLIEPEERKGVNREQQVATISRRAKNMAKQLEVPVVMLAQLARETEKNPGRRPAIWNLRESGAIEQDANVVLLIHRLTNEDQDDLDEKYRLAPSRAVLMLCKNRDGRTGDIDLDFERTTLRFSEHDTWIDTANAFEPHLPEDKF
jgi:replicative DNA helicase